MKNTILSLTAWMFSLTIFAQTESPHLSFKGVPIDGTLNEYVQKMQQRGFTYIGTDDNGVALLMGDFAAYKGCTVGVATLKQQDLVSKIAVVFHKCDTWSTLSDNYYSLKEMLTEKYGDPIDVIEEFQSYSDPTDDRSKFIHVITDACKYITTFETPKGRIQLHIDHNLGDGFVVLSYFDKSNGETIRAKAMEDL